MIPLKQISLLLLLSTFTGLLGAQDLSFNMAVTSAKSTEPFVMKVSISGSKMAMEPQNMGSQGKMTFLVDNTAGKQYMLMEANGQKMAMAVDLKSFEKAAEAVKEPKVTYTKETKTIDGYKCTKVITETDENKSDLWITQDVGMQYSEFYKMLSSSKGPQGSIAKIPELKNMKGFPVEIVSTDKKKNEITTLKIKNISKAKVDPNLFSMKGYQVMDAGSMTR